MSDNPSSPSPARIARRARHDGWSAARVTRFLETLAETGCVRDAARVAGMSDTSAYRLRAKDRGFAAAWEKALEQAQEGLIAIAYKRAVEGKETIIIRHGEEVERRIAPSDAILSLLVKRGDLNGERAAAAGITYAEHCAGWHFDADGRKTQGPSLEEQAQVAAESKRMGDKVCAKITRMHGQLMAQAAADTAPCSLCGGPMTEKLRSYLIEEARYAEVRAVEYEQGLVPLEERWTLPSLPSLPTLPDQDHLDQRDAGP